MRVVWVIIGGLAGALVGAVAGGALALVIAKPRHDGTFGMREMLVCLPSGLLLGLVAGVWWGLKTTLGHG